MKTTSLILLFLCSSITLFSQVTLDANGTGTTYEEITAVLAPGFDPVEETDCNHIAFGRHIDEIFDADLNTISDLRDEEVLFAKFSISELGALSNREFLLKNNDINLFPNPAYKNVTVTETEANSYTSLTTFNQLGQAIIKQEAQNKFINTSNLSKGLYIVVFSKDNMKVAMKRLLIN